MKIGILALQGAFLEHERMLETLNTNFFEIRNKTDAEKDFDGLILPGGESTVQRKLLFDLNIFSVLKEKIDKNIPVLATCAGLILLSQKISNDSNITFGTLPIEVKRNAYGRQPGSFHFEGNVKNIGNFPMEFIRAPIIQSVFDKTEVLSETKGIISGVKYKNQLGFTFHPELTDNNSIHKYFLSLV